MCLERPAEVPSSNPPLTGTSYIWLVILCSHIRPTSPYHLNTHASIRVTAPFVRPQRSGTVTFRPYPFQLPPHILLKTLVSHSFILLTCPFCHTLDSLPYMRVCFIPLDYFRFLPIRAHHNNLPPNQLRKYLQLVFFQLIVAALYNESFVLICVVLVNDRYISNKQFLVKDLLLRPGNGKNEMVIF